MGARHPSESLPDPEALADPTGEGRFQPLPFLVRKHRNRAVVLAASRCFFYCRFCFRRGTTERRGAGPRDWQRIADWLGQTPDVREVILSGGDPLTLSDANLKAIARLLASVPSLQCWRIHTRAPVTYPDRVTESCIEALNTRLPLRVAIHVNHPAELRPSLLRAVKRFQRAGVPVLNQTVLLAGVNDDSAVLAELFRRLTGEGVTPYYLHHPDRAPGNSLFRISLRRGRRIYEELRAKDPAPAYVLDLPNGAGKCAVEGLWPVAEERGPRGRRLRYRWTRPADWDSLAREEWAEFWDIWEP
jgi:lysine 2,3-aminomutase